MPIGSTPLFALGVEAKQDAWLAILITIALTLVWLYTEIQTYFNYYTWKVVSGT
ncbi:GerAB/ArcD/ProY family transporter [Bacillus sp. FJAT-47783]|uniref:GerAB/ArcD/ProY family transporter n=1 Tax=Bacillus sp. FJAT-47783 TaxID=2922712 RepID=UPI00325FDAED